MKTAKLTLTVNYEGPATAESIASALAELINSTVKVCEEYAPGFAKVKLESIKVE